MSPQNQKLDHDNRARRRFLAYFSGIGLTSTLFPGLLWGRMQEAADGRITPQMIRVAEQMAGLEFSAEERDAILERVNQNLERFEAMREISLHNSDFPALEFNPVLPGMQFESEREPFTMSPTPAVEAPPNLEEAAFWPVTRLSQLIRSRQVSSLDLTRMYLGRLKRFDPQIRCVITLTEDLALRLARRADQEIAAGRYRGPLHGIPWGVKDLAAARGYKTTWGAAPTRIRPLTTTPPWSNGWRRPELFCWPNSPRARWPVGTSGSEARPKIPGIRPLGRGVLRPDQPRPPQPG